MNLPEQGFEAMTYAIPVQCYTNWAFSNSTLTSFNFPLCCNFFIQVQEYNKGWCCSIKPSGSWSHSDEFVIYLKKTWYFIYSFTFFSLYWYIQGFSVKKGLTLKVLQYWHKFNRHLIILRKWMHGFRKANPYVAKSACFAAGSSIFCSFAQCCWCTSHNLLIFFSTGFKSKSETAELLKPSLSNSVDRDSIVWKLT